MHSININNNFRFEYNGLYLFFIMMNYLSVVMRKIITIVKNEEERQRNYRR